MTSTSPEPAVVHDIDAQSVSSTGARKTLRTGHWTRLGSANVLGDQVTERALGLLADQTRDAASAQGYAMGWAEGRRAAEAAAHIQAEAVAARADQDRHTQQTEQAQTLASLAAARDAARARLDEACARIEAAAVDLALQIAEAVIGREIATAADPGSDAIARALALMPEEVPVTVRLNPADRATLGERASSLQDVTFVSDATIEPGGAAAETPDLVIDATIDAAIARVRQVLLP